MLMPLPASAKTSADATAPSLSMALEAVPGLDTDWIQALGSDAQLTRYANARWPDHLPEVLSSVIQRSLGSSNRFSSVRRASSARDGEWLLHLQVEKFYGLRNAAGETTGVVTEFSGSVECDGRKGSFTLSDKVPVDGQRLSVVVAAHQEGLNDATQQLVDRIFEYCP